MHALRARHLSWFKRFSARARGTVRASPLRGVLTVPTYWMATDPLAWRRRQRLAEQQVRTKFPALIEGSTGWRRALENRLARIREV